MRKLADQTCNSNWPTSRVINNLSKKKKQTYSNTEKYDVKLQQFVSQWETGKLKDQDAEHFLSGKPLYLRASQRAPKPQSVHTALSPEIRAAEEMSPPLQNREGLFS